MEEFGEQKAPPTAMRFLSFANDKEDAEKEATLKEAAAKIEQAIQREKALSELVDYKPSTEAEPSGNAAEDFRPLFERLLEQKNKKQEALEESQKLSNLVTTLDEDDADYLNEIARNKRDEEIKKRLEIYDAMEGKRRLNEQKLLEEERRKKESLLGSSLLNARTKATSSTKSRLSTLIKLKPKMNAPNQEQTQPKQQESNSAKIPDQPSTTSHESVDKGSPCDLPSSSSVAATTQQLSPRKRPGNLADNQQSAKRQNVGDKSSSKQVDENEQDKVGNVQLDPKQREGSIDRGDCNCPTDITRCAGILPSLPIVTNQDDLDIDSDNSDNDDDPRIVPYIRTRK